MGWFKTKPRKEKRCETCAYRGAERECRRFPPQILPKQETDHSGRFGDPVSHWPKVSTYGYCGEWKEHSHD
jgi:hypothetical protein